MSRAWPQDTEGLWRCEIIWHGGYRRSRFEAVAHEPGSKRGEVIGRAGDFRWLFMDPPDAAVREYPAAVRALAAGLEAAGWEPAGRGPGWWALRFVWRRGGRPPEPIEPVTPPRGPA